MMNYDLELISY